MVIWITGLPGAGKSTIANRLLSELREQSFQTLLVDGDYIREALQNFDYDTDSRKLLSITYARLAKMFSEQGSIVICATVSMFDEVRTWNSENIENYLEVYVQVSAETLKARNQKGLYLSGSNCESNFALGSIASFEEPKNPDLVINNDISADIGSLVNSILVILKQRLPKLNVYSY